MPTVYTSSNRLALQVTGENPNTWGDVVNSVIRRVDESTDGVVVIDTSTGSNITLTTANNSADQARKRVIWLTNHPTATSVSLILPDVQKNYTIVNNMSAGSNIVRVRNISDASGVRVSAGSPNMSVVCNGAVTVEGIIGDTPLPATGVSAGTYGSSSFIPTVTVNAQGLVTGASRTAVASGLTLDQVYPVGSVYINAGVATNPATLFGFGTWTAFGTGRVLVGIDAGQSEFDTLGETGGAKTHTLSQAELPSAAGVTLPYFQGDSSQITGSGTQGRQLVSPSIAAAGSSSFSIGGSSSAHNNLQPYIVVHMWQRTA